MHKDTKKMTIGGILKELKEGFDFERFPLDIFPEYIQKLIKASHSKMGFPEDITAAGILFAISTAMGQSVRLLNPLGYFAKPIIWVVIVAPRGSTKSHPINKAIAPIKNFALEKFEEYEKQMKQFKTQEGGKKPRFRNPITNNSTIEGLYEALKSNPKGIGIHSDELSAWIKDFNKFNKGGDQQAYTQLYDGSGITVTRKNSETLILKETFVSICGSIQPTVLPEIFNDGMTQSGFTDRFLFQFPKGLEFVPISTTATDRNLWNNYNIGIRNLLNIDYNIENPMYLRMEGKALNMFIEHYNEMGRAASFLSEKDPARGIYSKMLTNFGRFPLLIHGANVAFEGKLYTENITEKEVMGAVDLTKYFLRMNKKAIDIMTNSSILDSLPEDKLKFYESLPDGQFTRKDMINLAQGMGLSTKTADRFISNKQYFKKVSWGEYQKTI